MLRHSVICTYVGRTCIYLRNSSIYDKLSQHYHELYNFAVTLSQQTSELFPLARGTARGLTRSVQTSFEFI